jgi:hypothetical protein
MVALTCHPRHVVNVNRRITVQANLGINARPYSKIPKAQRAMGVTQVVEHQPSMCKPLSSNPTTTKKKK